MKALSASIIVLAAALLILGGSYIQHDGTKLFVVAVGCGVGWLGMRGWWDTLKDKQA